MWMRDCDSVAPCMHDSYSLWVNWRLHRDTIIGAWRLLLHDCRSDWMGDTLKTASEDAKKVARDTLIALGDWIQVEVKSKAKLDDVKLPERKGDVAANSVLRRL